MDEPSFLSKERTNLYRSPVQQRHAISTTLVIVVASASASIAQAMLPSNRWPSGSQVLCICRNTTCSTARPSFVWVNVSVCR